MLVLNVFVETDWLRSPSVFSFGKKFDISETAKMREKAVYLRYNEQ